MDIILYSILGLPLILMAVTNRSGEDWAVTAFSAAAVVGGVYFIKRGSGGRAKASALQQVPLRPVAEAGGVVEIAGTVGAREPIIAPFTGLNAAFVHWRVEGFRGNDWRTLGEGWSVEPFFVADASGRAAVEPDRSDVRLTKREYVYDTESRPGQGLPSHLETFLTSKQIVVSGLVRYNRLRFREQALLEGDEVHVVGEATGDLGPLRLEKDLKVRLRRGGAGLLVVSEEAVHSAAPGDEKDSSGLSAGILLLLFSLGLDAAALYARFALGKR